MIIYDMYTCSALPKRASPGPYRSRREMSQLDHVNDYYYYYTAKQLQPLTRQTAWSEDDDDDGGDDRTRFFCRPFFFFSFRFLSSSLSLF